MTSILKSAALIAAAVFYRRRDRGMVDSTHPQGTTIVRTETIAAPQNVNSTASTGLSVNQIYRRAGLGVGVVRTDQGLGTGFVIDSAGHVLTNAHVVLNANDVQVELPKTLGSGEVNTFKAKVLGLDKSTDVAVLQIDAPADQLHPLTLAPSGERPQVGQTRGGDRQPPGRGGHGHSRHRVGRVA